MQKERDLTTRYSHVFLALILLGSLLVFLAMTASA